MKKALCMILSLLLVLALAACKPPVDGPDMKYHDPTTDAPTNVPTEDPGDDPGVPADTEDPTEPEDSTGLRIWRWKRTSGRWRSMPAFIGWMRSRARKCTA